MKTEIGPLKVIDRGVRRVRSDLPYAYLSRSVDAEIGDGLRWHNEIAWDLDRLDSVRSKVKKLPGVSVAKFTYGKPEVCRANREVAESFVHGLADQIIERGYDLGLAKTSVRRQFDGYYGYQIILPDLDSEILRVNRYLGDSGLPIVEQDWVEDAHLTVACAVQEPVPLPWAQTETSEEAIQRVMRENPIKGLHLGQAVLQYWT